MIVSSPQPFPDLEAALIEWAADNVVELISDDPANYRFKHVGDELPSAYRKRLPFLVISVTGGPTDGLTWYARVRLDMHAEDRSTARRVLAETFARMGSYPRRFSGVSADTVEVAMWPARSEQNEPDDSTAVCFSGELNISVRRQKGT